MILWLTTDMKTFFRKGILIFWFRHDSRHCYHRKSMKNMYVTFEQHCKKIMSVLSQLFEIISFPSASTVEGIKPVASLCLCVCQHSHSRTIWRTDLKIWMVALVNSVVMRCSKMLRYDDWYNGSHGRSFQLWYLFCNLCSLVSSGSHKLVTFTIGFHVINICTASSICLLLACNWIVNKV